MNRIDEINNFLKYFAKLYSQNPHLSITEDTFRDALMNYGLSKEEIKDRDIENNFNKWIKHFKGNKNINVFHHPGQKSFLQFLNSYEPICAKLYVSFGKEDMYKCVNKIFEFIARNKMSTTSNVRKELAADSVVIRLQNLDDAKKVIKFINNDKELTSKWRLTNPFLIRSGIVGLAYDKDLSYNQTISAILQNYFNFCRRNNEFNNVDVEHFKKYIVTIYNNLFANNEAHKNDQLRAKFYRDTKRYGTIDDLVLNYDQVFQLIHASLDPNINETKYFELLNSFYHNQKLNNNDMILNNKNAILDNYILHTSLKYGNQNVILYLQDYIKGNNLAITRDNNFRTLFRQYLPSQEILRITNNNVLLYINQVLTIAQENLQLFINACSATYLKYGLSQLTTAILNASNNNFNFFTNDGANQYRDKLKNINCANQINYFCHQILNANLATYQSNPSNLYTDCALAIEKLVYSNQPKR